MSVKLDIGISVSENAELRLQLAEAQEQCIEVAVDAGELHARTPPGRRRLLQAT